jgi:hypothetical protein
VVSLLGILSTKEKRSLYSTISSLIEGKLSLGLQNGEVKSSTCCLPTLDFGFLPKETARSRKIAVVKTMF